MASAATVLAVKYGELDGNRHPYVGLLVAQDAEGNPLWRCSGTLLSPTLFLTAGHCTEAPAAHVEIWFDADVDAGIPANGYPFNGNVGGIPYTHPQYDPNAFFLYDLGVVVLDAPVNMPAYGALPKLDALDRLKTQRGQQDVTFTAVGYGVQASFPDAAAWKDQQRARAVPRAAAVAADQRAGLGRRLFRPAVQQRQHRRDLLRRLGWPELHRRQQRDRRCHVVCQERQLRRLRWRLSRRSRR